MRRVFVSGRLDGADEDEAGDGREEEPDETNMTEEHDTQEQQEKQIKQRRGGGEEEDTAGEATTNETNVHTIQVSDGRTKSLDRRVSFAAGKTTSPAPRDRPSRFAVYRRRGGRCCRRLFCSRRRSPVEPLRYVTADGVEIIEANEDEEECAYETQDSFYSYDNDPKEHHVSECHRFCRREFSGLKLRHWISLSAFFLLGLGLAIYLVRSKADRTCPTCSHLLLSPSHLTCFFPFVCLLSSVCSGFGLTCSLRISSRSDSASSAMIAFS